MPSEKIVTDDPTLFERPIAKVTEQAMKELRAEGIVLVVQGGPHHGEASILCDPEDANELVGMVQTTINRIIEANKSLMD